MNTYEIRITNKADDDDFCTEEAESTSCEALMDIVKSGFNSSEVEFHYGKKYIVIFAASDEGYIYDIYASKEDYENDSHDSLDGGQCTSTLSNAIEMALSQA